MLNKVFLLGRVTRDPEIRYATGENAIAIANYSLAVDRRGKDAGTDFPNIVAFGKAAEFVEKYVHKGTKLVVEGRLQTDSYTDKDGHKVYTTKVIAESQEFAESKKTESEGGSSAEPAQTDSDGFMNVPEGIGEEELPFAMPKR